MLARQYRRSSENGDYWRLGVDLEVEVEATPVDTIMIPSPSSAGSAYNDAGDLVRRAESMVYSLVCGHGLWGVYLGQRAESTGERRYNKICFVSLIQLHKCSQWHRQGSRRNVRSTCRWNHVKTLR